MFPGFQRFESFANVEGSVVFPVHLTAFSKQLFSVSGSTHEPDQMVGRRTDALLANTTWRFLVYIIMLYQIH